MNGAKACARRLEILTQSHRNGSTCWEKRGRRGRRDKGVERKEREKEGEGVREGRKQRGKEGEREEGRG